MRLDQGQRLKIESGQPISVIFQNVVHYVETTFHYRATKKL